MLNAEVFGTLLAEKISQTPEFKAEVSKIVNRVYDDLVCEASQELTFRALKDLGLEFSENDGMEFGMTCEGDVRVALTRAIAKEILDFYVCVCYKHG